MTFIPARNKLEAVARISQLTNSGPETLGPGSKERRSVLDNLARGLGMDPSIYESKQSLAASLARRLNFDWSSDCESVGQTITLKGLNLLLQGGTSVLASQSKKNGSDDLNGEVDSLSQVLDEVTPRYMDGRECVTEMKDADADNWRQTEWQGWYFEFKAIPALINKLGGGPKVIGNTKFDYALTHPWDLKAHSVYGINGPKKLNNSCLLNDQESVREAVSHGGLGLIILSGIPMFEDISFTSWHKQLRGKNSPSRRRLKDGFKSERIEFFFFENLDDLERCISNGIIVDFNQGRQPSGEKRAPKFSLQVNKARADSVLKNELIF